MIKKRDWQNWKTSSPTIEGLSSPRPILPQETPPDPIGYLGMSLYPGDEIELDGMKIWVKAVEGARVRIVIGAPKEKVVKRKKFVQD